MDLAIDVASTARLLRASNNESKLRQAIRVLELCLDHRDKIVKTRSKSEAEFLALLDSSSPEVRDVWRVSSLKLVVEETIKDIELQLASLIAQKRMVELMFEHITDAKLCEAYNDKKNITAVCTETVAHYQRCHQEERLQIRIKHEVELSKVVVTRAMKKYQ